MNRPNNAIIDCCVDSLDPQHGPSSFVAEGAASWVSVARSFRSRLLLSHLPSSKNYVAAVVIAESDLVL